jgi:hypothetical protein
MILEKIISGGQTGADEGGLQAAFLEHVTTGGTAPRGYRTDIGEATLTLRDKYGLAEHSSPLYPPRTKKNVHDSDGTVIFGDPTSRGSKLTIRYCETANKPYIVLRADLGNLLAQFILDNQVKVLNVAGNRASTDPDVFRVAVTSVRGAIRILRTADLS